ncbi:MAG: glycosyltransferase [Bdellovibrionales bacterium]|nr:glycosyltransferase [Bdellovibrionales bacterium]
MAALRPDLVHLQHEFGLFGSKLPWSYRFPKWFASARRATSNAKWVATAHTVIDANWRYPTRGRGWKAIPLAALNILTPVFRSTWMEKTWGGFDGVIVHSALQSGAISASGCKRVVVIPHYVPEGGGTIPEPAAPTILLFGYFSPEKGQDIAIHAWSEYGPSAPKLILAGGVRRDEDRSYHAMCVAAIDRLGLKDRIEITGFVPEERLAVYFARATIVLAPFRETSGSGSLATAIGHHSAILASDHPLNREIDRRVPGSLAFFTTESPASLADEVRNLLDDSVRRTKLREAAGQYAAAHSISETARRHFEFYRELFEKSID